MVFLISGAKLWVVRGLALSSVTIVALVTGNALAGQSAPFNHRAFLEQAVQRVNEYEDTFRDLTAEETFVIRLTDKNGNVARSRTIVSTMIVYRSQADPNAYMEYRDVGSVDGKQVKDHDKRAVQLLEKMSDAKSVAAELDRLTKEGTRYNHDVITINMTLLQGLPLRPFCRHAFSFTYKSTEEVRGIATRVYKYQQYKTCDASSYKFGLPADFEQGPKMHEGTLWLETDTARLVREERTVYATSLMNHRPEVKVMHAVFDYQPSAFDIFVPLVIEITSYRMTHAADASGTPVMQPRVYLTQKYGPFSRFEVSVEQKIESPKLPK